MGPLAGVKIVELAGLGPAPFCCMMLADMGADIVRVDRVGAPEATGADPRRALLNRNRRSIAIDLKRPEGVAAAKRLVARADALVEGFRPGVMERLGLGPDAFTEANPRLVYGRMTGWGQDGPLSQVASHDINFISVVGALNAIGPKDGLPVPPLNLLADFGGGAMYLAFGIVCALFECRTSGRGQVIDAAMVDGSASLMTSLLGAIARGEWRHARGDNTLDGGAPWYSVYETLDSKPVSIGAVEPQFYSELLRRMGLDERRLPNRHDRTAWPELRATIAAAFRSKTRDEWCTILEDADVCFSPVLDASQAPQHAHLKDRGVFVEHDGVVQPAPAPRFSRTRPALRRPPPLPGEHTVEVMREWGFAESEIDALVAAKAIARR